MVPVIREIAFPVGDGSWQETRTFGNVWLMIKRITAPCITLLVLATTVGAQAPVRADIVRGAAADSIHADILKLVPGGFAGAIIVEQGGAVILKSGYGWANRDKRIPFTTSTIAQVGSLTKQFTATAVVDLAFARKLRITDSIGRFFPNVAPVAAGITVAQLLTHTAGLPDDCGRDFDRVGRDSLIAGCLKLATRARPAPFSYSNLGYSVLGAIVERVSGEELDEYLARRFFVPLGMLHTGYQFAPRLRDSLASPVMGDKMGAPISEQIAGMGRDYWNLKGNGGMQASTDDMYTWFRSLKARREAGDSLARALFIPRVQRDTTTVWYGYGWFIRTGSDGSLEQASHTGSDGTFFSAIVWRPRDATFYYLVTSSGEKDGAALAGAVLRRLRAGR